MKAENIAVSIIVPVYNSQDYLKDCIESLIKQTLRPIEILCIDDGSTDDSGRILKEYAERYPEISVIWQSNRGVSAARNTGLAAARGQYVYYLDSDDYVEPDLLETAYRELNNNHLDIVCFDTAAFGEAGIEQDFISRKNRYYARSCSYPSVYSGEELLYQMIGNHDYSCPVWKQVVRRSFLQEQGVKFYEGIIHEDELYTFRTMIPAERAAYIPRILHHRRLRQHSITTSALDFQSVYGYFICAKEVYCFLLNRKCGDEKRNRFLAFLRESFVGGARNEFLKLKETDRKQYELLSGEEKFLFRIGISDYVKAVEQRKAESEKNRNLLKKEESLNRELLELQQQVRQLEQELQDVKNSWLFKTGTAIALLPRKIRSFFS